MTTQDHISSTIVKVNPQAEEAYLTLTSEATRLRDNALDLAVFSPASVALASADLALLSVLKRSIEANRKEYVDPLNGWVKSINDVFRPLTDLVAEADRIVRTKVGDYNKEQDRIRVEAERIEALRREAEEAAAKLALEAGLPPPPPTEPVAPLPQSQELRSVDTAVGSMNTRKVWKWELVNFVLVADKFKVLNEVLVGKMVRAGERDIPGVRIYSEDEIAITPKVSRRPGPAPIEEKPERGIPF